MREFLGEVRPGGRNRGGAGVPGCVCAPGTEENLTCGDHAPRINTFEFRSLPPGVYEVKATLLGSDGGALATVRHQMNVNASGAGH